MTPAEQLYVDELREERDTAMRMLHNKMVENEKLGTQVTNLRLDVERRDAIIEGLKEQMHTTTAVLASISEPQPKAAAWTGDSPCPKQHIERRRLKDEHRSDTIKVRIGGGELTFCEECGQALPGGPTEAYVHIGYYPDNAVGCFFVTLDKRKDGDLASVGFSLLGRLCSRAIQMGVPAKDVAETLTHQFDESGGWVMHEQDDGTIVRHPEFGHVNGFSDLLGRLLARAVKDGPRGGGGTAP